MSCDACSDTGFRRYSMQTVWTGLASRCSSKLASWDLEGIVARHKYSPYATEAESAWLKIRNRSYSQWVGREQLFERDRYQEPAAGGTAAHLRVWDFSRSINGIIHIKFYIY